MKDLIERQATIDAMAELQGRASTKAELKGIHKAWKRIKQLSSAQPEVAKDTNVPINDCISRQAAIDTEGLDVQIRCEMCRNPMHTDRGCDGNCKYDEKLYERIMQILGERIKPLPSVQPDVPDTNVGDMISRQTAIDALDKHLRTTDVPVSYPGIVSALTEWLNELPSAEPEYDCVLKQFGDCSYDKTGCSDCEIKTKIRTALSAQPDLSSYSDKLWRNAYERGKADAEPKLIPCSKRLPEVNQWVLCQCKSGRFDVLWLSEEREWNNAFATYMISFVLSWQPLPEPYREENR